MPLFSCELVEHRRYKMDVSARDREEAELLMRSAALSRVLEPETLDVECEIQTMLFCEQCGEQHYGPECPRSFA